MCVRPLPQDYFLFCSRNDDAMPIFVIWRRHLHRAAAYSPADSRASQTKGTRSPPGFFAMFLFSVFTPISLDVKLATYARFDEPQQDTRCTNNITAHISCICAVDAATVNLKSRLVTAAIAKMTEPSHSVFTVWRPRRRAAAHEDECGRHDLSTSSHLSVYLALG